MVRPREWDRLAVAHELIEWARKPDSINFNKFCCTHNPLIPPTYLMKWAKEDEEFRIAYDIAKSFLGARREEKLNNEELHVKAFDFNATVYDLFAREEKNEMADLDSARKQREEQASAETLSRALNDNCDNVKQK